MTVTRFKRRSPILHLPARILILAVACLWTLTAPAAGMFMLPNDAPVDRLIENLSAYIKEHPQDPQGYYTLGRVHYLAWSHRTGKIGVFSGSDQQTLPNVADDWLQKEQANRLLYDHAKAEILKAKGWAAEQDVPDDQHSDYYKAVNEKAQAMRKAGWKPTLELAEAKLDEHVVTALQNLHRAVNLDKNKPVYHLTFASVLDQAGDTAGRTRKQVDGETDADAKLSKEDCVQAWRDAALDHYMIAYKLAIKEDAQRRHRPVAGIQVLVSYNAANGYIALFEKLEGEAGEKKLVAEMKKSVAKIKKLPIGAITPIVFSLDQPRRLVDLLDQQRVVAFDLDGDGLIERRPWLRTDTAILVWDPTGAGEITSGRQLFGSVTWWLFWDNGYRALDALDDNRDGKLAAGELRGLAVWRDRNQDGASQSGEVTPIEKTAVIGIACHELSEENDCPMNPSSLELNDGRVLPTYDWIAPTVTRLR